jgi:hypothetical protein
MPDPRQGGDDKALAIRDEPPAPEPKWVKPPPHFSRERFLLRCVAWIIGVQFGVFILAAGACTYGYYLKARLVIKAEEQATVCPGMIERIRQSATDSLAVLLALLGGGTIALNEAERRRRDDPREGDRLPPPR